MCRVQDGERHESTDYLDQLTATRARSIEMRQSSPQFKSRPGISFTHDQRTRQLQGKSFGTCIIGNSPIYADFFPPNSALFVGGVVVHCNHASANDSRKSRDTGSSSQVSGPAVTRAAITRSAITRSPIRRRRPEGRPDRSAHFLTGQALHCRVHERRHRPDGLRQ